MMDDLIREHLPYEVDMMNAVYGRLTRLAVNGDVVTKNALIESFALHVRNLTVFFETLAYELADATYSANVDLPTSIVQKMHNQIFTLSLARTIVMSEKFGPDDWRIAREAVLRAYENFRSHRSTD
jgi:hypothetical protein